MKPSISNPMPVSQPQPSVNLINNFNNNMRNQSNGFPHAIALYDFEAENAGELSFKVSLNVENYNDFFFSKKKCLFTGK